MIVEILPPKYWWHPTRYRTTQPIPLAFMTVPAGVVTDGATVSRWLVVLGIIFVLLAHSLTAWLYLPGLLLILTPALFPRVGLYFEAAVVHDYLLDRGVNRKLADCKFKQMLIKCGVKKWRANLMYAAVMAYGFIKKPRDYINLSKA